MATTAPALPDEVADLARRIHFSRVPVVPLADVVWRLQQAGHDVATDAVRDAIMHPSSLARTDGGPPPGSGMRSVAASRGGGPVRL
jgi:hypothetical protein